jgi:stage V sporulation protein D (sporulation-specific penicillin-binding protein)
LNEPSNLHSTRKRLLIFVISITFLFTVLAARLCYIQLVQGRELQKKAADQWYRTLPLGAPRGKILDRNGVVLADNKDVFTVYVRPRALKDARAAACGLADALNLDEAALLEKFTSARVSELTVKRKVDPDGVSLLRQKNIEGIYFAAESKRNYPDSPNMSQILGFTNIDNAGQSGLEMYYDAFLKGTDGLAYTNTDMAGREVDDTATGYLPSIPGCDLTLAADRAIQGFAEYAVISAQNEWQSKSAAMIVMDCADGGVLAMAATPGFDLNEPPRDNIDLLNELTKNKLITDVYEPGSTFKIFTTAAAIESGKVSDADRFYCSGSRVVDGQRIKCWRSIGHGSQTLAEGVMNSCNCVFMDLALRLGTKNFYSSLHSFGFDKKTNIDFSGESRGILLPEQSVKQIDLARIGFGQAVAVTPLQLAAGVCAAVNGGNLFEPYFVKSISDYAGRKVFERAPKIASRPVSAAASEKLRTLLESVVVSGGGKKAQVAGYRIGGKTGTAQKYENGRVAQGKYVSSFIGFAPADNPRYVVLMIVDEPGPGAYYGSIVAAPYAAEVFGKIFDYTAEPPAAPAEPPRYVVMPDVLGMSASEAAAVLKSAGLECEIAGDSGAVVSSLPIPFASVKAGDVVLIRLEG